MQISDDHNPSPIRIDDIGLYADIGWPGAEPRGIVLFAHGSGSSRRSARNRAVASHLVSQGLISVLMDLLTEQEEQVDRVTREHRFNIPLLARRVVAVIDWLAAQPETRAFPVGTFGASTGAAAALIAAAERRERVAAVVSRGGRPDLAGNYLPRVHAPTLLIVGGHDPEVIGLNREAATKMQVPAELEIIPGATHLFEEPGAMEQVSALAARWFLDHL